MNILSGSLTSFFVIRRADVSSVFAVSASVVPRHLPAASKQGGNELAVSDGREFRGLQRVPRPLPRLAAQTQDRVLLVPFAVLDVNHISLSLPFASVQMNLFRVKREHTYRSLRFSTRGKASFIFRTMAKWIEGKADTRLPYNRHPGSGNTKDDPSANIHKQPCDAGPIRT